MANSTISASTYDPLAGIDWGTQISGSSINVYFAPNGVTVDGSVTSEGFNSYEISRFEAAFSLIESVTNLTFNRVYSKASADFVIGLDTNGELAPETLGYMNPPGYGTAGNGVFNGTAWDRSAGGDLEAGGYGFVTIVHEFLHGLGLAHPHDTGGTSSIFPGVTAAFDDFGPALLNQGIFTTMSYNTGFNQGPVGTSAFAHGYMNFGYEYGPMALDIAVLQDKYGVNTTTASGDNIYVLPGANTVGTYYQAIWDTGGTDTIKYGGAGDVTISLHQASLNYVQGGGGFVSAVQGIAGGFTIAHGVQIENAQGGRGDDRLIGNVLDNRLTGNLGADVLNGFRGSDRLFGGGGNDKLFGGAGVDLLVGGGGRDVLRGSVGHDVLNGGAGNDRLFGGADADTFKFFDHTGRDTVMDFVTGVDHLRFDEALWGGGAKTAHQIVAMADITSVGVVWDFGGGDVIQLKGVFDTAGLEASIFL